MLKAEIRDGKVTIKQDKPRTVYIDEIVRGSHRVLLVRNDIGDKAEVQIADEQIIEAILKNST